ncbi:MAG: hypothetical protein C0425_04345 [Chlorobiaceae bacterium]|nr:hypothetical protein [Chlorobiaceae bacterium]MBA4309547.1 hypothetical protein [Chlorobiaceae bacterium]
MIKNKLKHFFIGDRKYFSFVVILLTAILLIGFFTPRVIDYKENNWSEISLTKQVKIENEIIRLFQQKQKDLINSSTELISKLKLKNEKNVEEGKIFFSVINDKEYSGLSILLFDSTHNLIGWNQNEKIEFETIDIDTLNFGSTEFIENPLNVFLFYSDTLSIGGKKYFLVSAKLFEQKYTFSDKKSDQISFTKLVEEQFSVSVKIGYNHFKPKSLDGREFSFSLLNNLKKQIGVVTALSPSINADINTFRSTVNKIQTLLIFIGFFFFIVSLKSDFKKLSSDLLKILLIFLLLFFTRWLLFSLNVTSLFVGSSINNPNYFSSTFAGGIVKSPLEFLITNIFLFTAAIILFHFCRKNQNAINDFLKFTIVKISVASVSFFIILLGIRGISASIKSVIFDSTLRFFRDQNLFPQFPLLLMNINVLLFTISGLILLLCLALIIQNALKDKINFRIRFYLFLVATILLMSYLFITLQKEPLISFPLLVIVLIILGTIHFIINLNKNSLLILIVSLTVSSSFVSIILLNHFNLELEKQSLKRTAIEINRPDESYFTFLLNETLLHTVNSELISSYYAQDKTNFNSAAFVTWKNSSLVNEAFNSSISFLDKNRNLVGSFSKGVDERFIAPKIFFAMKNLELQVLDISEETESEKIIFSGITPIISRGNILGYIVATIKYDPNLLTTTNPIYRTTNEINDVIRLSDLGIIKISDRYVRVIAGDFIPTEDDISKMLESNFTAENEVWIEHNINHENFIIYIQKEKLNDSFYYTAVFQKEREVEWILFNFFKISFIHSIILLLICLTYLLYNWKEYYNIVNSFRYQLLFILLLTSILPILALAIFNRINVEENTNEMIYYSLSEKLNLIESHVKQQLQDHPERELQTALSKVDEELNISFNVYRNQVLYFSSENYLKSANVIGSIINPAAYSSFFSKGALSFYEQEFFEGFPNIVYYRKFIIDDENYIFSINDLFNEVYVSYNPNEFDIFLFGVYSFAIIIIIIFSSIIANRFSKPIRQLTSTTQAIALGDLNIQIENRSKGELGDLINNFNKMTNDLKRTQKEIAQLERESAWKEMAKQVAHEIKNPLTPMKLMIQQLVISYKDKSKNFDESFGKITSTLLNQIETMNQIASEFSRFARMPNYNSEIFDLLQIINEIEILFKQEKIEITTEAKSNAVFINADRDQIRRVFINLTRNSIQANANKIVIEVSEDENKFFISVKDNGSGIDENVKEKIFNENFTTKNKGMGIGLKLAAKYLSAIEGKIELFNSSSTGTTFLLTINKSK